MLRLKPQEPAPAYETIPSHPTDGPRLEFIEQGENGYHILSREQRSNPESTTTTQHMEMILEDSREESYSKLELREENGSTKKANEESIAEYSKLEMVNIGSNLPKDTIQVRSMMLLLTPMTTANRLRGRKVSWMTRLLMTMVMLLNWEVMMWRKGDKKRQRGSHH